MDQERQSTCSLGKHKAIKEDIHEFRRESQQAEVTKPLRHECGWEWRSHSF